MRILIGVMSVALLAGCVSPAMDDARAKPATLVAFIIGILQSVVPAEDLPWVAGNLPFYQEGMAWIIPTIVVFMLSAVCLKYKKPIPVEN